VGRFADKVVYVFRSENMHLHTEFAVNYVLVVEKLTTFAIGYKSKRGRRPNQSHYLF